MPAIKMAGEEGGGYSYTRIPSIAIDRIQVHRGSRGVQYGNGTDGGVFETNIKYGRGYDDHFGGTVDTSSAGETIFQSETADGTDERDYYLAGS